MSEYVPENTKDCPFCGWHTSYVTAEGESSPRAYFVQCANCWACGPAAGREVYDHDKDRAEKQKAIDAWNKRTSEEQDRESEGDFSSGEN